MSHSNKKARDPLIMYRYVYINRRIYKVPTLFENPGIPESKRGHRLFLCDSDGMWYSLRYKKPRGTPEASRGNLRSYSPLYEGSRGLSDDLVITEQRLREAEEDVRVLRPLLADLQRRRAQELTEREGTIPSHSGIRDRSRGSSDDVARADFSLREAEKQVIIFRAHLNYLRRRRAQAQEGTTPPRGSRSRRGTDEDDMRPWIRHSEAQRSGYRRSIHRLISRSTHTERYNYPRQDTPAFDYEGFGQVQEAGSARLTAGPRPSHASSQVQPEQSCDGIESMRPLPLFQSPSSRTPPRVRDPQLSQGSNGNGKPQDTINASSNSDGKSRLNDANNQAKTLSASIPSDVELDIRMSYEDSSQETQARDDSCGTPSEPPTEYVLANEEDYPAEEHSESPCPTSPEPVADYVLANEEDYLANDDSDREDDA